VSVLSVLYLYQTCTTKENSILGKKFIIAKGISVIKSIGRSFCWSDRVSWSEGLKSIITKKKELKPINIEKID
jgi:hypothetical protein